MTKIRNYDTGEIKFFVHELFAQKFMELDENAVWGMYGE